jgi:chromosomal replication initiator protein
MKGKIEPTKELLNEIRYLCEYFNIPINTIISKERTKNVAEARHFIIAYLYRYAGKGLSSSTVGMILGDRDHSTVLHSCRAVDNWKSTEQNMQKKWDRFISYARESAITKFDNIPQF